MLFPRSLSLAISNTEPADSLRESRRSASRSGLFAFLVGGALLFGGAKVGAQATAASHFGNVSAWKGKVSVSGSGKGSYSKGCAQNSFKYNNNQSIEQSPEINGVFPQWTGPAFTGTLSLVISDTFENTCSAPLLTVTCMDTITGLGGISGSDDFQIKIDPAQGTYTLVATGRLTNVVATSDCTPGGTNTITKEFPWGPTSGPSGGPIPLLNAQYSLPSRGVKLKMTIPTFTDTDDPYAIPWDISWDFSPVCKVSTNHLGPGTSGQGARAWGSDQYDHDPAGGTISQWGCALTCLSMALNNEGITQIPSGTSSVPNNPGSLNTVLTNSDTDYGQATSQDGTALNFGIINWDAAVRDAQCGGPCPGGNTSRLHFHFKRIDSREDPQGAMNYVDEVLCGTNPHPVVVGVKSTDPNRHEFPGHFVLVTGRNADDSYDIADPAGKATSLSAPPYNGVFATAGYIADPQGDLSGVDLFLNNNASMLVTDPNNLQTGAEASSGNKLQMIPQSSYFEDALDNDITGEQATNAGHLVMIFQPVIGRYVAVINGLSSGPYQLSIRAFSQDGSSQQPIVVQGTVKEGSTYTYIVNYSASPGSTSTVTPMPGDRNGDGVVNCRDLDIVKASFGKRAGESGFDPRADVNGDGIVNVLDLSAVARQLSTETTCP